MKKSARILLWGTGIIAVSAIGLRYAALPYAEGQLLTTLNKAGFSEAVLERTGLGFYTLSYSLRSKAGEAVMAELTLNPIASLIERQLHLASVNLWLTNEWKIPGYAAQASTDPAIKALEKPLSLPGLSAQIDELKLTTPLGPLTAKIIYGRQKLSASWQFIDYAGDATLLAENTGAYSINAVASTGAIPFQLNLKGGEPNPVLSASGTLAQYILGPVSLQDIKFTLNSEAKPGYALPFTATATLVGKPIEAHGVIDALKQTASGTASGDVKVDSVEATGIKLAYELTSLVPPVVKNNSSLSATAVQAGGLPLIAPRATFGFANNKVSLQSASAGLFGGKVTVAPTQIALPLTKASVTANFEGLDLSQVLQLAAVDGLGGDGKLSGTIPVTYDAGHITLGQAQLKAVQNGQIHYTPAETPSFLAEGGQAAMLGEIFKDFRYSGLTVNLGGTLGDNLTLGARLEGANPSFYNGHSVALNLNLSGALESLLKDGLQSFQLSPEAIKQMSEEGQRP